MGCDRVAGRKDKYETNVKPNLDRIRKWAEHMTEAQMAKCLDVSNDSWIKYKNEHIELAEAIKNGRQNLVPDLHSALIKRGKGYRYTEKKTIITHLEFSDPLYQQLLEDGYSVDDLRKIRKVREEIYNREMPPDVAALNLLLKNYDKDAWANDPQALRLREKELELRERQIENAEW